VVAAGIHQGLGLAGRVQFGLGVALSGDGATLGVQSGVEDYVFTRTGVTWSQQALFGIPGPIALSANGLTLAIGSAADASAATGLGGDSTDMSAAGAGAVFVYTRSGAPWTQQSYVKASNTDAADFFGYAVALSADGNTMAVGAYNESSNGTGVDSTQQANNALTLAGAMYLY
jgi:hypothetical protein